MLSGLERLPVPYSPTKTFPHLPAAPKTSDAARNGVHLTATRPDPNKDSRPLFWTDPETAKRIRVERAKSRALRKTRWWKNQLHQGICRYCGRQFQPDQLSMDHIVPLARGGKSTKGNIVPACVQCNRRKQLETPAEAVLRRLETKERDIPRHEGK